MNGSSNSSLALPVDRSDREVVYSPDQHLGLGWNALNEVLGSVIGSHELIWRLFRRNIIARYRQSVLGYVWALVPSLVMVASFTYLNRAQLVPIPGTEIPYPLYVLLGMTIWQFFADGITKGGQSLVTSWSMVTKINFAKESLVLASLGESLLDFVIRLVVIVVMFAWFGLVPAWTAVLVPLMMVPLFLLTAGIGLMISLVNSIFRDIANVLPLLMTYGIFLAPVVYPPPTTWPASLVNYVNPVSPFVIAFRDLMTRGTLSQPFGFALGCFVAVVVFLVGLKVFHQGMLRIVERV